MVSFGQALTHTDITEFSNFLLHNKNQKFGSKSVWLFYDFDFKNNYGVLKSKSPCFLLDKNVNFHRNATESKKWKIPHRVLETGNLCLSLNHKFKKNCDKLELTK